MLNMVSFKGAAVQFKKIWE